MGKHYLSTLFSPKSVAGFGEAGASHAALENELLETARRYNISLNCLCIMHR